jgi:hypothetical protein
VLCKDRLLKKFRSQYSQRPTQSSVLRRIFGFNGEVAEYAHISYIASRDNTMLAQEGIDEHIPGYCAPFVIKSSSTNPNFLHYYYKERSSYSYALSLFTLFSTFLQGEGACSGKEEGCQGLTDVSGSNVTIER